jgi:replication initiation and membrane attachment protein DnaB
MGNFIKQSTQQKEKRRNKERGPKSESEEQNPKWVTKGAKEQNNLHTCVRGESEAVID